jgi:hypothetical protein
MTRAVSVPKDLRSRLEQARLDSLALFRALDRLDLSPPEIPQRLLQALFEQDADCAEALWALDQTRPTFNLAAMVRNTLATLANLAPAREDLRRKLHPRVQPRLRDLEPAIRAALEPREAHNDVPGRDPQVK